MLVLAHVSSIEDEAGGINPPLIFAPSHAVAAYVGAILLARDQRLFLNVIPSRSTASITQSRKSCE